MSHTSFLFLYWTIDCRPSPCGRYYSLPLLRLSLSIQGPRTTTTAPLPCWIFSVISLGFYAWDLSPFGITHSHSWHFSLGNPRLGHYDEICSVVGWDFRHLPLLMVGLFRISCGLQTAKYNPPEHQRIIFHFVGEMVSPSLWLSFRQYSFLPHTEPFVSTLSRSLEVSLTCAFTNVLLFPLCFHARLVVDDRLCISTLDIFTYCILTAISIMTHAAWVPNSCALRAHWINHCYYCFIII